MSNTYVFEIGCEELPSSSLEQLRDALVTGFQNALNAEEIHFTGILPIAAPRRLGVIAEGLSDSSAPKHISRRGPAVTQAYKDGAPTGALLGFCKGLGINADQVTTEETEKGAWVSYSYTQPGQPIQDRLGDLTTQVVSQLPLSKPMRWGSGRAVFPRPVHWVVALLNEGVVPFELFGLQTSGTSFGHRVHHPEAITIRHAKNYREQLTAAYVVADFDTRRELTWKKIQDIAAEHHVIVTADDALLSEITCLVEWPVPLIGQFESDFLKVPDIALVAAMRGHQKYFHTRTPTGALSNHFITVANIESIDPAQVIAGNQRVIRARLSDARFFFETDRQAPLASRRASLNRIAFQPGLGSLGDKTERVTALVVDLCKHLGLDEKEATRAASLSRCDLATEMVLEFDELQGQMGGIYARADGEPEAVSQAIDTFYLPAGPNDSLPTTQLGLLLGLADRLDTLAGLFAIDQPPTGSKDPFGLRRAALAVLRINATSGTRIDLGPWIQRALELQPVPSKQKTFEDITQFFVDRERGMLLERGIPHDIIAAAQGAGDHNSYLTGLRAEALAEFRNLPQFEPLIAVNKRIVNILSKSDLTPQMIQPSMFTCSEEASLFEALESTKVEMSAYVSRETYAPALELAARLAGPLSQFFDQVLVNDPEQSIRHNRYALLNAVHDLLTPLGDLSQIQG